MSTISTHSDAQREASRTNGAKSNGPVSIEGKDRSCQNATKHGLRSPRVVLSNEDPNKYQKLLASYVAEWNPLGITESDLLVRMANAPRFRDVGVPVLRRDGLASHREKCGKTPKRTTLSPATEAVMIFPSHSPPAGKEACS